MKTKVYAYFIYDEVYDSCEEEYYEQAAHQQRQCHHNNEPCKKEKRIHQFRKNSEKFDHFFMDYNLYTMKWK